jgi:hypothetical protein
MWLPSKLYERLPLWWILVGLLFMLSALYLGLDYGPAYGYLGLGVGCSVFGLLITIWRAQHRSDKSTNDRSDTVERSNDQDRSKTAHS